MFSHAVTYVSGLCMGKGWREGKASEKSENPSALWAAPPLKRGAKCAAVGHNFPNLYFLVP